jgi:magnesium chelatase family protein
VNQGTCNTIGLNGLVPFEVQVQVIATEGEKDPTVRSPFYVVEASDAVEREVRVRVLAALANVGVLASRFALKVLCTRIDTGTPVRYSSAYDLATALATLVAVGAPPSGGGNYSMLYVGELGLDGSVKTVRGRLTRCRFAGHRGVVVAEQYEGVTSLARVSDVYTLRSLNDYVRGFVMPLVKKRELEFKPVVEQPGAFPGREALAAMTDFCLRHKNLLIVGRAGSGKLTLARRYHELVSLVPSAGSEVVDVNAIYDVAGLVADNLVEHRPFRAPHHTVSEAGLVGGAGRPGEVSLAHGGVLLLDELPEFRLSSLHALASTLKSGYAEQRHEGAAVRYPAVPFAVVATASPCLCGARECKCSAESKERYRVRLAAMAELFNMETYEVPA